ncbi:MAG: 4-hydroxy-tetrahydrodipicolinate synthase [Planctomycetota bacterium]
MDFRGNFVALVTPFRQDGSIDWDALERLVEDQIAGRVSGLVPCGTTGESPTLSHEEHDEVIARVVGFAAGRVPVVAGTGSNSTAEAIRSSRHAEESGAAALLLVAPYYNKPSQEGLYRHYHAIAEACGLPIVVYNIPGRCSVEIAHETLVRLAAHPRIVAVKEATGNLLHVSELRRDTGLQVLAGDDALTLPALALGGCGVVSVASNLEPARMSRLVAAALAGDLEGARAVHDELFPLMKGLLSLATNPLPVKTGLALRGKVAEVFRLPLCPMAEGPREELRALVEAL